MRATVMAAALCLSLAHAASSAGETADLRKTTNIPPQQLSSALQALAKDRDFQIVCRADLVKDLRTAGISGEFTAGEALLQLLRGTNLTYRYIDDKTVTIIPASVATSPESPRGQGPARKTDEAADTRVETRKDLTRRATQEPAGALEKVTVTSQRRQQSIMDVGVNVTTLSQEEMREYGIKDSTDVASYVPGVVFNSDVGANDKAFLSVRGVSQNDLAPHEESPNSIYIDEVYVASSQAASFPSYDMQRVEVLRGPQGTLFGRNATGGLLQFITSKPTSELTGYVNAQYGSFEDFKFEAAVSGPLSDVLRGRVAAMVNTNDGWFKNDIPGHDNLFNTNFHGIRAELATDLTERWDALATISYNRDESRGGAYRALTGYIDQNGVSQFLPRNVNFYGTGPGANPFGYLSPTDPFSGDFMDRGHASKETAFATLKVDGRFGAVTLESISNYSLINDVYQEDCLSQLIDVCIYGSTTHERQWSQELRLLGSMGRFQWSVGGYSLGISGHFSTYFNTPAFDGTPSAFDLFSPFSQNTHSHAGYGQVEVALTSHVSAIVGGRLTHDYKTFDSVAYDTSGAAPVEVYRFDRESMGGLATQSLTNWQGKFELDYKPEESILLYASVNRAIRAGGFNAISTGIIPVDRTPFKSETNIAYEVGGKYRSSGGLFYLNASTFYYDYRNYQALNFQALTPWVSNFPANSSGGELEVSVRPMSGLTLAAGGSYLEAKIKDFFDGDSLTTVRPVMAPRFTAKGKIRKEWSLGQDSVALMWDLSFFGRSNASLIANPVTTLPASVIQNARASYTFPDRGIELYAFANNFLNRAREIFAYDVVSSFETVDQTYAPPRWFGAGVRFTF